MGIQNWRNGYSERYIDIFLFMSGLMMLIEIDEDREGFVEEIEI